MPIEQSNIKERTHIGLKPPKRYIVYIHNDDFTTMDFVVKVLMEVFHKSEAEAYSLMLSVHHSDKAPVGTYSYDMAATKIAIVTDLARSEGFPLRLTMEPA